MNAIGQPEKKTQERVIKLLEGMGYEYLGDLSDQDNDNLIPARLQAFLEEDNPAEPELIPRAIELLRKEATNSSNKLYDRNREVYGRLRYGVQVRTEPGAPMRTVRLINWDNPGRNHFAIAEEVTIQGASPQAQGKRPDIVLYVNGIALAVLELKRSTVSVAEGIRQNLDNQKKEFIEPFFSTIQLLLAGNDTEGLRYGTTGTTEKHYLEWKEDSAEVSPLDRSLRQLCSKPRLLELIHDFVVFDAGIKKLCRHNQYFGVKAAQPFLLRREGGILWHTQGSGKSLTMVWLARWIREHVRDARVLIITDRTELDEQIERVFKGVQETIYRTSSGADLIATLGEALPWLLCSLIHKFGGKEGEEDGNVRSYVREIQKALPVDFRVRGELFVFVDECHRTQSGELHDAMKEILPDAVFIGFTGTPLLKADKKTSVERFGRYIHTYRFDEAVRDRVVLDLRYEARDIAQQISSQGKIDQWFESKTSNLTDLARAQLKARWGTMQKVLSSKGRLQQIVNDISFDMETRDRLKSGHGNAMLVAGSIYEACKLYELFNQTPLKGKCAIVTSYVPRVASIKGEESGEGDTEALEKYQIYRQMIADWFQESPEQAVSKAELFEQQVKKKFIEEPGQMKLLIVVNKLLTGFDAPPATYLYIDQKMRDHGLFQAICRVNRLDGEDKEYGYIVDYKDLFHSLEGAVNDYTSGALDGYEQEDVAGLLKDRLHLAREHLEECLEAVRYLCAPVPPPREQQQFFEYFSSKEHKNALQLKTNEPRRLALYKLVAALLRAYAAIAPEMAQAGYSAEEAAAIKKEVSFFESVRREVKLHSGDAIDLKMYEPAMRHLIDTYIKAEESRVLSTFEDLSLVQLIVERGPEAVEHLPEGIRQNRRAAAETIENNVRRLITDESPVNPKYYEKMSVLLEDLIEKRKQDAIEYEEYLRQITDLTRQASNGPGAGGYPSALKTPAQRAIYDNLNRDEQQTLKVHDVIQQNRQDGWRTNVMKTRKLRQALRAQVGGDDDLTDKLLELAKNQHEY